MSEFASLRLPATVHSADGSGTGTGTAKDMSGRASAFGSRINDGARDMAEHQKRKGAQGVGRVAKAARSAADELNQDMPKTAAFIQDAARQLEETSSNLRDRSIGEVIDAAGEFARRKPIAFVGCAAAAGFLFSRFLKSSSPRRGEGAGNFS